MTYANADVYAPDDASLLPDGSMQRTMQDVYRVVPQCPAGAVVGQPVNPWVSLAIIGGLFWFWSRRKRG